MSEKQINNKTLFCLKWEIKKFHKYFKDKKIIIYKNLKIRS